jgi:hypothetical protein
LLEQRIAARSGDASDATDEVLRAAARNDPGPGSWRLVDASDGAAAQNRVVALVNSLGSSHIVF